MADELNTSNIYQGTPMGDNPEEEIYKRGDLRVRRANLPKLVLAEGEKLYITREQVEELNKQYFVMLDEMEEGFHVTEENLRSYMESVVCALYINDIQKMQRAGEIEGEREEKIYELKKQNLTADLEKYGFRQRKERPNYQLRLCMKEARIEADIETVAYRYSIARQNEFFADEPMEFVNSIIDEFVPPRKLKRFSKAQGFERLEMLFSGEVAEHSVSNIYRKILEVIVPNPKRRKKFTEKNGEYLKGLIKEYLEESVGVPEPQQAEEKQAPKSENAENEQEEPCAANDEEDELDELDELQELEEESAEEPAVEHPETEQLEIEIQQPANVVSEEPAPMLIPQGEMPVDVQEDLGNQSDGGIEPQEPKREPTTDGEPKD